jgi:hypothetical protein
MAQKTRLEMQIEASMKKIQQEQAHLKALEKSQAERNDKARTHRLCKRHGLLESFLPITIDFTDEQYEKFVKQHITNKHGIAVLANITGQTVEAINNAIEEAQNAKWSRKSVTTKSAKADTTTDEKPTVTVSTTTKNNNTPAPTVAGQKSENQQLSNKPQNTTTLANPQSATA